MDIKKHAGVVTDKALINELNKTLPVSKAEGGAHNGFWALVSVEKECGDEDGDIICVDGIEADLNPDVGRYLPVLPSHMRKLSDGMAPEIGRIECLRKTSFENAPALAMYFTFALDEKGNPIDQLVKSYYDRYRLGYSNAFSVGMKATSEPIKLAKGGFKFGKTKLYEVSCVSIPANPDALGLTRSKEQEDELTKLVRDLQGAVKTIAESIPTAFKAAFEPLESRLDMLEAALVSKANEPAPEPIAKGGEVLTELSSMLDRLNK